MEFDQVDVERMALQMSLDHMRYALGVLDRSEECPEIAAHLDLAVSRLADELATRELPEQRSASWHSHRGHLWLAKG